MTTRTTGTNYIVCLRFLGCRCVRVTVARLFPRGFSAALLTPVLLPAIIALPACRTDTEYNDALIGKLFVFSFVNSYASLFYVAFLKYNIFNVPCNGPCMVDLAYQLTILFGTNEPPMKSPI